MCPAANVPEELCSPQRRCTKTVSGVFQGLLQQECIVSPRAAWTPGTQQHGGASPRWPPGYRSHEAYAACTVSPCNYQVTPYDACNQPGHPWLLMWWAAQSRSRKVTPYQGQERNSNECYFGSAPLEPKWKHSLTHLKMTHAHPSLPNSMHEYVLLIYMENRHEPCKCSQFILFTKERLSKNM